MPVNGLLNSNDLEKIASILEENGYGNSNITVVINVRTKGVLSRINEDFFYRNNVDGTPPDVDEVNVDVGEIHFKYIANEDGN